MKDHKEFIKGVGMILIGIVGFLVLFSYSDLEIRDYSGEGKVGEAFRIGFGGLTGRAPSGGFATATTSTSAGGISTGVTTSKSDPSRFYYFNFKVGGVDKPFFIEGQKTDVAFANFQQWVKDHGTPKQKTAAGSIDEDQFQHFPVLTGFQHATVTNFRKIGYVPSLVPPSAAAATSTTKLNLQLNGKVDGKDVFLTYTNKGPLITAGENFQFEGGGAHALSRIPTKWYNGKPHYQSALGGPEIRITEDNVEEIHRYFQAEQNFDPAVDLSEYKLAGYIEHGGKLQPVMRSLTGQKKYFVMTPNTVTGVKEPKLAGGETFTERAKLNDDPKSTVFLYRPQKVSPDGSELEDSGGAPYLEIYGKPGTKHFIDPRFAAEIAKSGSKNKDFSGLSDGSHRIVIRTSETKTTEFVLPPESKPNGIQIREEHQEFKDEIHNKPVDIILRASSIQPATSTTPLVEGSTQFKPVFIGPDGRHLSLAQAKRLKKADVKFDYVATQQIFLERASPDSDVERSVTVSYTQRRQKVAGKDDQYFKIATVGEAISGSGFLGANKYEAKYIIMPGKDFDPSKLSMVGGVLKYNGVTVDGSYKDASIMAVAEADGDGGLFAKVSQCDACTGNQRKISQTMMRQRVSQQLFQRMDFALTSMSGLQGFSTLMYGKEEIARKRQEVDVAFCETLGGFAGGTDCWTSKICSTKVDKVSDGTLLMEVPGGMLQPVAHVEASRQVIQFQNATGFFEEYIYKISFNVDNPDYWRWGYHGEGEGLFFQVFLFPRAGGQPVPLLSADNPERRVDPGDETNRGGDDILVLPSKTSYDRICLNFMEKSGKPKKLILGIGGDKEEESEVCNIINDVTPNFDFIPPGAAPFVPGNQVIPGINPI